MAAAKIEFDRELITRCQMNAPRYTSYPTADRFSVLTTEQQFELYQVFKSELKDEISLYIHIPFCNTLCLYCACNKIITNQREKISQYIDYLAKEFALYYQLVGKRLKVVQLHFGGGSPSWLPIAELRRVMLILRQYFDLTNAKEIAMELDPRHVDSDFMYALQEEGFNRVSLGVQDFDLAVQKAVNRIQPLAQTQFILELAAKLGFSSSNIDLIYGLPLQSLASYQRTIDIVINQLKPARIALFNYAHLPQVFMPQTRINQAQLPSAAEKLNILQMCVERLAEAGYVFIGMDHFARPDDELAIAMHNGTLQRNFQGYSTCANTDMLAFGVSSIGLIANHYYQNNKDLTTYYQELDQQQLPFWRGLALSVDDNIRRNVIQQIMCQFALDYKLIEKNYHIEFTTYFAEELEQLAKLAKLGLVELDVAGFKVSNKGRFLLRNIAVVFDQYLQAANRTKQGTYSQVI